MPAVLLGRTGVLQFKDNTAVADQAMLMAAAMLAPPAGSQYEVWLVDGSNRLNLGLLALDGSGRGELTFTDEQKLNLIENYSGVEVTIEPAPDPDPEIIRRFGLLLLPRPGWIGSSALPPGEYPRFTEPNPAGPGSVFRCADDP